MENASKLDKFETPHNISYKTVSDQRKSVDPGIITDWTSKLKDLCQNYASKNIYNFDERGLFLRVLPEKTMSLKNEICSKSKISKSCFFITIS